MTKRVLNPNQLKMFMRPDEIKGATFPGDKFEGQSTREMWEGKEETNTQYGMAERVVREGVHEPVTIVHGPDGPLHATSPYEAEAQDKPVLADGHHRVQAAAYAERNGVKESYVPVEHTDMSPWQDYDNHRHF